MSRPEPRRFAGQALAWLLFFGAIGLFSNSPPYRHLGPDEATVTLSLRHAGQLVGECRTLGAEELAKLPATMRAPTSCPRERAALRLELELDGRTVLAEDVPPRGIHRDGMATMYRRIRVPAGPVELRVRMKDSAGQQDFPYQASDRLTLAPAEVLVIDFDAQQKRFVLHRPGAGQGAG